MEVINRQIRKIAVTGINGFPGKSLLKWLDDSLATEDSRLATHFDEIVALDIAPPREKLQKTRFFKVDLTEANADQRIAEIFAVENVNTVLHLAFQQNPSKSSYETHELHTIGTMYLLNACSRQKVEKIVVHSTTHCYGAFPDNPNFLSETHRLRGGSQASFIRDLVDVEKQLHDYQTQYPACHVITLRTCTILGPSLKTFATQYLSRNVCLVPLGFDPLIQAIHESDVLKAFQLALEKNVRGAFNIVGKGVVPLRRLLQLAGRTVVPVANTLLYPLVQVLWQSNVGLVPPEYLHFLRYLWVADGVKAEKVLGFTPSFNTRETVLAFAGEERLRRIHLAA